ncbi:MAG: quinolinate synthase NadA [Candidatus Thorarchaeota archaeon]|nr:quinolinate synthase NadA [Candidatus Thorarchaeota archaeon]
MLDSELSSLQKRILRLKEQRKALILAHNYQPLEIQRIADFVGDSLQLARKCKDVQGYEMIVFSAVRFMAEMAAVLSPDIPVYLPSVDTLCPMAAWLTPEKIREKRKEYPGVPVVVYVNTTADVKAEADVIVTSGSAVEAVRNLGVDTILFGPDKNLAEYIRQHTDVKVIDIEPRGHCYVHQQFDLAHILLAREQYPDAVVIAHPECPPEVQLEADLIGSTGMMVKTVAESTAKTFVLATEIGLIEQLQAMHPDKTILPAYSGALCRQMKKNSLERILRVLEELPPENIVRVSESIAPKVRAMLEQMGQTPAMRQARRTVKT